jgi:hypothetical protein
MLDYIDFIFKLTNNAVFFMKCSINLSHQSIPTLTPTYILVFKLCKLMVHIAILGMPLTLHNMLKSVHLALQQIFQLRVSLVSLIIVLL